MLKIWTYNENKYVSVEVDWEKTYEMMEQSSIESIMDIFNKANKMPKDNQCLLYHTKYDNCYYLVDIKKKGKSVIVKDAYTGRQSVFSSKYLEGVLPIMVAIARDHLILKKETDRIKLADNKIQEKLTGEIAKPLMFENLYYNKDNV